MASRSFRRYVEQELGTFPHFVIYAILEWMLILMLFIDGFLSFLSYEFAKFFELKSPCLLCTRIDHLIVQRSSKFYYNEFICEGHKRDISSLAYCHVHRKLSDIWSMCEGCLLSFSADKESDRDTYKSLVGILQKDIDRFAEDDPRNQLRSGRRDDLMLPDKSNGVVHRCSCCGEPLKMRPTRKHMARSSSINGRFVSQAPAPSPRAPLMTWKNEEVRNLELPHVRYTELKFMSDNDLELPEDEDHHPWREKSRSASVPLPLESEDIAEDVNRTPSFTRGNKFFGIPLTDSASASPRFSSRLSRKIPFERSDVFSDATDVDTTNEADADSILNRLKRQARLDRSSLIALHMELDEERSASAIAANNAMAMITRLQAEKAAVQMEALQYQRMMEEQAEYDQEALQVMKDMLGKKESEVKTLEAELEVYREKYGLIKRVSSEECEVDADEDYQEMKSQCLSYTSGDDCASDVDNSGEHERGDDRYAQDENGTVGLGESLLNFARERYHLLGLLTNLEKEVISAPNDQTQSPESNSDMAKHSDEDRRPENKASLTREMSQIKERLRVVEADSGFLKHAAMTLQKDGEGAKLLSEIAHHLRNLRSSAKTPLEGTDA